MNRLSKISAVLLLIAAGGAPRVRGAQIALTPNNVIGGSGSYSFAAFNSGQFNATQVLDNQTGTVTEPTQNGFWLNSDNGPADAYIVIDLGAAYQLGEIDLFNTHNAGFNDRGTGNFTISGANSVSDAGGGNYDLSGTVTSLISDTLKGQKGDPIASQPFFASDSGTYRYVRFDATSVATSDAEHNCCGANNYGLNEIRFFTPVPEPAAIGVLGALALPFLRRFRSR